MKNTTIKNKKGCNKYFLAVLLFFVFAFNFISAAEETTSVNYCCEKTVNGAWCQNAPESQCDSGFKKTPTSCASTSYCKQGCCFDSIEGLCMESTPQRVCADSKGTWANNSQCDIPQCRLGCCILGNQGAFVTLTRCKQLAGFYGLQADFRKSITDELTCIATAQAEDMGACVFEDPQTATKSCTFTTRGSCKGSALGDINQTNVTGETKAFYKDILCTAEELGTTCGPSTKTMLISGKDEIYFQDTCENPANIYDSSRYSDKQYWKKVFKKSESCGYGSSNANSAECGNCDYFLGSTAKKATWGTGRPDYGDYICADLNCKTKGGIKKHGESWCVHDSPIGNGTDTVGSRYFKQVCLNGEVLTEPCADFRNQICIERKTGSFSEAMCKTNRWQDGFGQASKDACENTDQRDCMWTEGYYFSGNTQQIEKATNDSNGDGNNNDPTIQGLCTPYYPAGSVFWNSGAGSASSSTTPAFNATTPQFNSATPAFGTGYVNPSSASGSSASGQCSAGNAQITLTWKKTKNPLMFWAGDNTKKGVWECSNAACRAYVVAANQENAEITPAEAKIWAEDMNKICYTLGDCGGYINFLGNRTNQGYAAYLNNMRIAGSGGAEVLNLKNSSTGATAKAPSGIGATGNMVKDFIKNMVGGQ